MYKKHLSLSRQLIVALILRISLAFALIYAAFLGFFHPFEWINYFPSILRDHFPDAVILNLYNILELIISAWLLWGNKIFIPSLTAAILLFLGIIFNLTLFNDIFTNVSLLGMAISLVVLSYPRIIHETELQ